MLIDFEKHPEDPNLIKARIIYKTNTPEITTDDKGRIKFENFLSPSKKFVEGWISLSEIEETKWKLDNWIDDHWSDYEHFAFKDVGMDRAIEVIKMETLDTQGVWE